MPNKCFIATQTLLCVCFLTVLLSPGTPPSLAQMFGKDRNPAASAINLGGSFPSNEITFKVTTSTVRATRDCASPSKVVKVGEIDGVAVVVKVSHPNLTNQHGGSQIAAMLKVGCCVLACFFCDWLGLP